MLCEIIKDLRSINIPDVMIMGDFNAKSRLWSLNRTSLVKDIQTYQKLEGVLEGITQLTQVHYVGGQTARSNAREDAAVA